LKPRNAQPEASKGRAFRGLFVVFALSFLNLVGISLTVAAIGGLGEWGRWQFVGLFGAIEAASGLASVFLPNIWRLPVAELQTDPKTRVKLAASAILLPHWGGLARTIAGGLLMAAAAWTEGVGAATLLLLPLLLMWAIIVLAFSAIVARLGVARPDFDVLQVVLRWGGKERELQPISIGASVLQVLMGMVTIPAVKLMPPSMLFQPELAPSYEMFAITAAIAALSSVVTFVLWNPRIDWQAPPAQQREAEKHA
jgi:hypothetical protein